MEIYDYLQELFAQMVLVKEEGVEYCILVQAGVQQDITRDIYVPKRLAEELVTKYRGADPMSEFFLCDLAQDKVPRDIQLAIIETLGFKHSLENLVTGYMQKILSEGEQTDTEGQKEPENKCRCGEETLCATDGQEGLAGQDSGSEQQVDTECTNQSGAQSDSAEDAVVPGDLGSAEDAAKSSTSPEDCDGQNNQSDSLKNNGDLGNQPDGLESRDSQNCTTTSSEVEGDLDSQAGCDEDVQSDNPYNGDCLDNKPDSYEDSGTTGVVNTNANPESPELNTNIGQSPLDMLVGTGVVQQTPFEKAKNILIKFQRQARVPNPIVPDNGVVSVPMHIAEGVESILFDLASARLSFVGEDGILSASEFDNIETMLTECLMHISTELLLRYYNNPVKHRIPDAEETDFAPSIDGGGVQQLPNDIYTPANTFSVPENSDGQQPEDDLIIPGESFIGQSAEQVGDDSDKSVKPAVDEHGIAESEEPAITGTDSSETTDSDRPEKADTIQSEEPPVQLTDLDIALQAIEHFTGQSVNREDSIFPIYTFNDIYGTQISVRVDVVSGAVSYMDTDFEVCTVSFGDIAALNSKFLCDLSPTVIEGHYTPLPRVETNNTIIQPMVDSLSELVFAFTSFDEKNRAEQLAGFNCTIDEVMNLVESILEIYIPGATVGISAENRKYIISDLETILKIRNIAPPSMIVQAVKYLIEEVAEAQDEAGQLISDDVKLGQIEGVEHINAFINSATIKEG